MFSRIAVIALFASAATLVKGANYGDGTYYQTGLGACGEYNSDTDYIAAVAAQTFDSFPGAGPNPNNNPICNKLIQANYQGRSVVVAITDRCGGCTGGADLDFSPAAFGQLADLSVGRLHGVEWDYI
ncbi:hypothetical protein PILCRDRAFT_8449 [Piloderma croceum F 1598]|uniref:RlpA-like protein double-psi beta-barrel domain-containing protein n=1 Tax=Piloderma croceum (strain F 1598) TaxID=765440 RepID=A0A0C3FAU4_PILCF|nr:hypothetical protein PILCRDRAFT_8449 [Piloderma croceum F 1598]